MIRRRAPFVSRETRPSQHGDARITFESVKENCGGRAEGSSEVPPRILISVHTIRFPAALPQVAPWTVLFLVLLSSLTVSLTVWLAWYNSRLMSFKIRVL